MALHVLKSDTNMILLQGKLRDCLVHLLLDTTSRFTHTKRVQVSTVLDDIKKRMAVPSKIPRRSPGLDPKPL